MRANLLITASFTVGVIVVVIASLAVTTSMNGSGAGVSATPSPAAAPTPEKPALGMPPSPTQPAAPPIVENSGADGELPLAAGPMPALPVSPGPPKQGPGPKPAISVSPGHQEQEPDSDPAIPANPGPQEQGRGPNVTAPVPSAGIVLGQTTDEAGNPHTLVLEVASPAREALLQADNVFAVISGGSRFSVTGDAAVDSWRFAVDSGLTGVSAPMVVIKSGSGSVQEHALDLASYTSPTELNDDAMAASIRLSELIADVISKASTDPDSHLYTELTSRLTDPQWTGVLIFNATATAPGEISGESTGALAGKQVVARNIWFHASPVGTQRTLGQLSGIIDQSQASGDGLPPGVGSLRAGFSNSALTFYDQG